MTRLDRHIAARVLLNFVLLFAALYLFAATVDIILNLDEFTKAAERDLSEDSGWLSRLALAMYYAANYHLPQLFQFYAWLYGVVLIGAAAFTLSQMSRHRELVAIAACGMSLRRVAAPILGVAVAMGGLQILNQEFMLPRLAPLLLRTHKHAMQEAVDAFPVKFTDDADGNLLQAASFDPGTETLRSPGFIQRDEAGRTTHRWWATEAQWNEAEGGWDLVDGRVVEIAPDGRGSTTAAATPFLKTDLSPVRLTMRRYGQIAGMLSLGQISDMLRWPDAREAAALRRSAVSRFAVVALNVLILMIGLPFFLDREPGGQFARAIRCAAVVLPVYFTAAGIMLVPLGFAGPLVGVLIPVLVLLPIAMARMGLVRT
ncbi:MAG: LptF/LptG family permease [Phycisphaerales bacterium]|jgi:lipopolysaccharide export system permease protein|nr:LptF/LptG family permease [Phycisphaerales bacterium]